MSRPTAESESGAGPVSSAASDNADGLASQDGAETAGARGFRMPAEWEPHRATWIAWPHNKADWPAKFAPIPWVFAELVRHLTDGGGPSPLPRERCCILVEDHKAGKDVKALLLRAGVDLSQVELHRIPTDRVWTRDSGPIFVKHGDGRVAATTWRFNAWAKYSDHRLDEKVGKKIASTLGMETFVPSTPEDDWAEPRRKKRRKKTASSTVDAGGTRVVIEGGAIDVNGQGTLLCTEECLLSNMQARNPHLDRAGIEAVLCAQLGVRKILWLGRGISGDDTHGHVDDLCRFVGPRKVLLAQEPDERDDNHAPLAENLARLRAMTDQDGAPLEVLALPMPAPLFLDGLRLPASYANFYIGNRTVLVPTFNDPNDRLALSILAQCFPERRVVGIHAVDLVWGLGTLHCMTQQEPLAGAWPP